MFSPGDNNSLFRPNPMNVTAEVSVSGSPSQSQSSQVQVQWGEEETRELIGIRGELEKDLTVATKRNKALWDVVSIKMKERGFLRTPHQCKCKWKNLINRYKGKETSDPDNGLHCPFFEELHAVFTERAKDMQRLLLESEAGSTKANKRFKRAFDEFSEDEDGSGEEKMPPGKINLRKRKGERKIAMDSNPDIAGIQEMLKDFFQQQQLMEMQWREMMERRDHEQLEFEQEWRQKMENIERERLMVEQAWREREEQRRIREEHRAERRDALLTTLLNKLIHENDMQGST